MAPHGLQRSVSALALVLLAAALVSRVVFVMGLPAVFGADPYVRLFHRDALVTDLYGRHWLPGYQAIVVLAYAAGGGLTWVRLATALLGALAVGIAFAHGARRFGLVFGLVFAFALHLDADFLYVAASPYQEPLFFAFALAALLLFARLPAAPTARDALPALLALLAACATRYEGLLLGLAFAIALAIGRMPAGTRAPIRPLVPVALSFAALPLLGYAAFTVGVRGSVSFPSGLAPERIAENAAGLFGYLVSDRVRPLLVGAAIGLALSVRRRTALARDVLAVHVFTLAFAALYLLWTPYIPAANRRFHLPLLLWLGFHTALAFEWGAERLAAWRPGARLAGTTALCAALAAFLLVDSDAAFGGDVAELARQDVPYRLIGERVDSLLGAEAGVIAPGKRDAFFGHPDLRTMRIFGYMQGSPTRLVFAEQLEGIAPAELAGVLSERGVRGMLAETRGRDPLEDRVLAALRGRGTVPKELRLDDDFRLVHWEE